MKIKALILALLITIPLAITAGDINYILIACSNAVYTDEAKREKIETAFLWWRGQEDTEANREAVWVGWNRTGYCYDNNTNIAVNVFCNSVINEAGRDRLGSFNPDMIAELKAKAEQAAGIKIAVTITPSATLTNTVEHGGWDVTPRPSDDDL